ncbi:MAG TPA: Glu/Leu/Phe/Val dehydrogenase dimerization domain-containing protein, partial [Candidatus Eisenbacteria bacterium]|nr:Glu/Leu/Phe/Val dehydrogenase dimerization domain-containing protein [Candidatus Eisenbacteria bacterium]
MKSDLEAQLAQGNGWWRIFEAINYQNYSSVEWWAQDWAYHKDWGTAVFDELNFRTTPGDARRVPARDPREVNASTYLNNPQLQKVSAFFRKNFTLYTRDAYQNTFMHAFLPIDERGRFYFVYKGRTYRGNGNPAAREESIWTGLDRITADVRNPDSSMADIAEALTLVNGWYADNTTEAKVPNVAGAINKYGPDYLARENGFVRLFTGHLPFEEFYLKLTPEKRGIIAGFLTQGSGFTDGNGFRLIGGIGFTDHGMAERFNDRGGWIDVADVLQLRGFEHKNSTEIVVNPRTLGDGDKEFFSNPGMDREAFLPRVITDVKARIAHLETVAGARLAAERSVSAELKDLYRIVRQFPETGPSEFQETYALLTALYGGSVQYFERRPGESTYDSNGVWVQQRFDDLRGLIALRDSASSAQRGRIDGLVKRATARLEALGIRREHFEELGRDIRYQNPFLHTFLGIPGNTDPEKRGRLEQAAVDAGIDPDNVTYLRRFDSIFEVPMSTVRAPEGEKVEHFAIRVEHNIARGLPAKGGLRWVYARMLTGDKEFTDRFNELVAKGYSIVELNYFLRKWVTEETMALSFGMTMKSAVTKLPYGGAKGSMLFAGVYEGPGGKPMIRDHSADPRFRDRMLRQFAHTLFVAEKIGPQIDVPAPDAGSRPEDMVLMTDELVKILYQHYSEVYKGKSLTSLRELFGDVPTDDISYPRYLEKLIARLDQLRADGVPVPAWLKPIADVVSTFTAKTLRLGGSQFRDEATGFGLVHVLKEILALQGVTSLKGKTLKAMGYGNVAQGIVDRFTAEGGAVEIISEGPRGVVYKPGGFTPADIVKLKKMKSDRGGFLVLGQPGDPEYAQYKSLIDGGAKLITYEQFLSTFTDFYAPAAAENTVTPEDVKLLKTGLIVEGANGAVTTEAERLLTIAGIGVVPDSLANAGGVDASYEEWVQNLANQRWTSAIVAAKVYQRLTEAVKEIRDASKPGQSMRRTVDAVALTRVLKARDVKGARLSTRRIGEFQVAVPLEYVLLPWQTRNVLMELLEDESRFAEGLLVYELRLEGEVVGRVQMRVPTALPAAGIEIRPLEVFVQTTRRAPELEEKEDELRNYVERQLLSQYLLEAIPAAPGPKTGAAGAPLTPAIVVPLRTAVTLPGRPVLANDGKTDRTYQAVPLPDLSEAAADKIDRALLSRLPEAEYYLVTDDQRNPVGIGKVATIPAYQFPSLFGRDPELMRLFREQRISPSLPPNAFSPSAQARAPRLTLAEFLPLRGLDRPELPAKALPTVVLQSTPFVVPGPAGRGGDSPLAKLALAPSRTPNEFQLNVTLELPAGARLAAFVPPSRVDLARTIQGLIAPREADLLPLVQQYETAEPVQKKALDAQIQKIVNEINVLKAPAGRTLSEVEVAGPDFLVQPFVAGPDYARYRAEAENRLLNGEYVPQFIFAGAATRLLKDFEEILGRKLDPIAYRLYGLDIYDVLRQVQQIPDADLLKVLKDQKVVDRLKAFAIPPQATALGLGQRQIVAYRTLLEDLAKRRGQKIEDVLARQRLVFNINEEVADSILRDFEKNKFYGFDRKKVVFIVQPIFEGLRLTPSGLVPAPASPALPAGHGYATTQLKFPDAFTIGPAGETVTLPQTALKTLIDEDSQNRFLIASHRVNDVTKISLEQVVDLDVLALSLSLLDKGFGITIDLVGNPGKQKGGVNARFRGDARSFLIETSNSIGNPELDAKLTAAAATGSPYNAFRLLSTPQTYQKLLDTGIAYNLRFKDGAFFVESVTGDLTQIPAANAISVHKEGELIHDFKQLSNLLETLPFAVRQDEALAERGVVIPSPAAENVSAGPAARLAQRQLPAFLARHDGDERFGLYRNYTVLEETPVARVLAAAAEFEGRPVNGALARPDSEKRSRSLDTKNPSGTLPKNTLITISFSQGARLASEIDTSRRYLLEALARTETPVEDTALLSVFLARPEYRLFNLTEVLQELPAETGPRQVVENRLRVAAAAIRDARRDRTPGPAELSETVRGLVSQAAEAARQFDLGLSLGLESAAENAGLFTAVVSKEYDNGTFGVPFKALRRLDGDEKYGLYRNYLVSETAPLQDALREVAAFEGRRPLGVLARPVDEKEGETLDIASNPVVEPGTLLTVSFAPGARLALAAPQLPSVLRRLDGDRDNLVFRNYSVEAEAPFAETLDRIALFENRRVTGAQAREEGSRRGRSLDVLNPSGVLKKGTLLTVSFGGGVPLANLERTRRTLLAQRVEIGLHTVTGGRALEGKEALLVPIARGLVSRNFFTAIDNLQALSALKAADDTRANVFGFIPGDRAALAIEAADRGVDVIFGGQFEPSVITEIRSRRPETFVFGEVSVEGLSPESATAFSPEEALQALRAQVSTLAEAGASGILLKPFRRKVGDTFVQQVPLEVIARLAAEFPTLVFALAGGVFENELPSVLALPSNVIAAVGFNPATTEAAETRAAAYEAAARPFREAGARLAAPAAPPQREDFAAIISDLVAPRRNELLLLSNEYRTAASPRKKEIDARINQIVDEINVLRTPVRKSIDDIEVANPDHFVDEFRATPEYARYRDDAEARLVNGEYVPQFIFAGAATRLLKDLEEALGTKLNPVDFRLYGLDLYDVLRRVQQIDDARLLQVLKDRTLVDRLKAFRIPSEAATQGLGQRQILAYRALLEELAKKRGEKFEDVLARQNLVLNVNEDVAESVLKDFEENNFYGFDRSRV